jgi:hypothetical protein
MIKTETQTHSADSAWRIRPVRAVQPILGGTGRPRCAATFAASSESALPCNHTQMHPE